MNNVKESIGWADYSWNLVTGCKNNCSYCYARKVWNRFHRSREGIEFSEIKFYPERLTDRRLFEKVPLKIFCDSMSDFEFWPNNAIDAIFHTIDNFKWHTFMFLSKNENAYKNFSWSRNAMQGITIEHPVYITTMRGMAEKYPRPFISLEPLMGGMDKYLPNEIELVIVGAETGNRKGKVVPQKEWIKSIRDHVPAEKIYWKKNIQEYL